MNSNPKKALRVNFVHISLPLGTRKNDYSYELSARPTFGKECLLLDKIERTGRTVISSYMCLITGVISILSYAFLLINYYKLTIYFKQASTSTAVGHNIIYGCCLICSLKFCKAWCLCPTYRKSFKTCITGREQNKLKNCKTTA